MQLKQCNNKDDVSHLYLCFLEKLTRNFGRIINFTYHVNRQEDKNYEVL